MKILYVITKANWGGAQRYVYDVAIAAKAAGNDVVVAVGGTGLLVDKLAAANVRTISLPLYQRRNFFADLFTFGSLSALVRLIRAENPDVVHTNSAKASGLGCFAARWAGVPRIIFTAHGWEFNASRGLISRIGIRFFSWMTILLSDETICVSEAVRGDVVHWPFIHRKLVVVLNGIECATLKTREEARASLLPAQTNKTWVGMISELHPTKRIVDALHAVKDLVGDFPNLILVVLGEGAERARLEETIGALGLRDRVFLLGFIKDAATYANAFDIFLHASRSESSGYAILEAGCASLPVVACSVGGIPEVIQTDVNGLLVEPENPSHLADALESYLHNPEQARAYGVALHETVVTKFSKEKMFTATLAQYKI